MTSEDDKKQQNPAPGGVLDGRDALARLQLRDGEVVAEGVTVVEGPVEFGTARYVHAAFIGAGLLVAFLAGRSLAMAWNALAEWPALVRLVPALIQYDEEARQNFSSLLGGIIGLLIVVQIYRKPRVRGWADDVATELAKVVWPSKEVVTNGTLIVLAASAIATVYVFVLDRFWAFVTHLVYGV